MKLRSITPGTMASAVNASRQLIVSSTTIANSSRMIDTRRRDDRHLHEARRRVDVAGQPRQDAAGLHVPELGQRQVQQPVEQRLPQRQHHARRSAGAVDNP